MTNEAPMQSPIRFAFLRISCNPQLDMAHFTRLIRLPEAGSQTFFLWGPRQSGKSTLLRERYPGATWIDLLQSEVFRRYATNPGLFRCQSVACS